MGPVKATTTCLARPLAWGGRAGRAEFWWFTLTLQTFQAAVLSVLLTPQLRVLRWWHEANLTQATIAFETYRSFEPLPFPNLLLPMASMATGWVVFWLVSIPLTLCWFAAVIRRLHDTEHSGGWAVVALVPLLGPLLLLVLLAAPGQLHRNRYGPAPYRPPPPTVDAPEEEGGVMVVVDGPEALRALRQARMQM